MARLKLFSANPVRRKLFSDDEGLTLRPVVCEDCGFELQTAQSASSILCPKCGGTRFNIKWETDHEPYKKEVITERNPLSEDRIFDKNRRSLFLNEEEAEDEFQRSFSEPDNEYERNLGLYSGKRIDASYSEKLFGISSKNFL